MKKLLKLNTLWLKFKSNRKHGVVLMVHIDDDWGHFSGAAEEIAPKILENLRKGFKNIFLFREIIP